MTTIAMKLKHWTVPNFANIEMPPGLKQDGVKELPSIPIAELDAEALTSLAHQWLTDLYAKAGKAPNWRFE